ncbi:iron uptake porin [Pseudanabaena sp. ABRG5-3]|uniref:iron uptake porin n=1 Tax=Pseudanabaena sp. ABRG5-3 TaxID=685565 RepID=UPI000F82F0A2|nr:iron uptake porin [Pseudanabaena sp. ABRG5-3]
MSKASQKIALSFPILLMTAIASTSSVNANEIKKVADNNVSTSSSSTVNAVTSPVKLDDVINVSGVGLQSPLPESAQKNELVVVPVTQLSDSNANLSSQNSELAAITSVSQLNDVRSTDWAFTALQSLVERYGVIAGYPDSTYRGKQALTRYEFAAGLNTALDKINEIISAGLADKVSKEDLATLQKLQEEFAVELSTLRGRVDALDAKTAKLEAQQFSATTKLSGSAQFLIGTLVSNSRTASTGDSRTTNLFFTYAANLRLNTSFTGKDLLSFTIGTSNPPPISSLLGGTSGGRVVQSNVANFALDGSTSTTIPNSFTLGQLFYRFPVGDQATIWLSARGLQFFDYFPLITPLRSGNSTAATVYGLFNPIIFRPGFTNTGIGAAYRFNDQWQIHTGYFASDVQASNPGVGTPATPNQANGSGLFGGSSTYAVQVTFKPSDRFAGSLNYVRKYWTGTNGLLRAGEVSFGGPTGTTNAIAPFGDVTTLSDTFGSQFDWRIFPKVGLGGGFSTTAATNLTAPQKASVFSASISLGFFDLFQEGNHAGILAAITPYVTSNDNAARKDALTPWLIEAFYTHRFNKNVSITPDIFLVLNPDRGTTAEPIWGFSLRTTFAF